MAVSGTISTTSFETRKVIDHAFRYCKLTPQQIGAEQLEVARDHLWMLLSGLANRGIQMWCVDRQLLPIYEGTNQVSALTGTVDILNANLRSLTRLTGSYSGFGTIAGNQISSLFDGDLSASVIFNHGSGISFDFGSNSTVSTVGFFGANTNTVGKILLLKSDDGDVWTQVGETAPNQGLASWIWYDLSSFSPSRYFRIVIMHGMVVLGEIFIGNNPRAIPMSRMNRDDYTALVNRTFTGRPLQYWLDRQRDAPVMNLWPAVSQSERYSHIEMWRKRYIMDVGTLPQTLDIPQRWFEAVVLQLASRVASVLPEVPDDREAKLLGLAQRAMQQAEEEERDNSPIKWAPKIGVYTR